MSRRTNKSNINFIDIYLESVACYIYKVTDNINKVYIGSTNTPDQRWVEHFRCTEDSPLHRSMKEVGIHEFEFEVIDTADYIAKESLMKRESVYMNEYNSIETGYTRKHSIYLQNLYYSSLYLSLYLIFIIIDMNLNEEKNQNIRWIKS
jgi:hypothetical protein